MHRRSRFPKGVVTGIEAKNEGAEDGFSRVSRERVFVRAGSRGNQDWHHRFAADHLGYRSKQNPRLPGIPDYLKGVQKPGLGIGYGLRVCSSS